ncbi:DMT family transporter [Clostridium sp. DL1XJH146]
MKKNNLGYFYLLNTIIFFSSIEVVSIFTVGKITSFQLNFMRFFFGGLFLLGILILNKEDLKISKNDFIWVLLIGILNVTISMNLLQLSLTIENAKASVVAVMISSNPIFVTIFTAIIKKEKIELYKIIGLVIGVLGIVIVFMQELDIANMEYKSSLLALIASIIFALYTVMGKKVASKVGSLKMNAYSFLSGSVIIIPFLLIFDIPVFKIHTSLIIPIAYLAFFVTGIAYVTYFKGLEIVGASKGSLVFFAKPVIASFLAIIVLHEKATLNLLLGTLLIIGGIYIVLYGKKIMKWAK